MPTGLHGHRCQFPPPRSCKHVMLLQGVTANGIYNIVDQQNISFPVYCDFTSEPDATWTLIQSHSLQNNAAFKHKAFYLHDMHVNQDTPEWNSYRLSIGTLSKHWRRRGGLQPEVKFPALELISIITWSAARVLVQWRRRER